MEPSDFGISGDLALIELLAIIYRKWVFYFGDEITHRELLFGKEYLEHIEALQRSRPPKPHIQVDRETLRFVINKIKKEIDTHSDDCEIELT